MGKPGRALRQVADKGRWDSPVTRKPADANQAIENKLTIGKILRDLSPAELFGALTAAATVIAGSFWVGERFSVLTDAAPIPCSKMPGWPQGRWWAWGRLDGPPTKKNTDEFTRIPQIVPEVLFFSNSSFETQSEQSTGDALKRVFRAHANGPLTPGRPVRFDGSDGTGYSVTETLTPTDDGCMLNGMFLDTDKILGSSTSFIRVLGTMLFQSEVEFTRKADKHNVFSKWNSCSGPPLPIYFIE